MDPGEKKALQDIEDHGCHLIHVLEDAEGPGFTYSIGIEKTSAQPELFVSGLKRELAHWIINEYNHRVRNGEKFADDETYGGFIEGFDVVLKTVQKKHYQEYFGWGLWLYGGNDFRMLQLVYPSTSGVWPWDEGASPDYTWFLPTLYAT